MQAVAADNGVVVGWALDPSAPGAEAQVDLSIADTPDGDGSRVGVVGTSEIAKQVNWDLKMPGNHGFAFRIPNRWRDDQAHFLRARVVQCDGSLSKPLPAKDDGQFTLAPTTKIHLPPVLDASCLSPGSRCRSIGDNHLGPNFPEKSDWSDGVNYFRKWGSTSSVGFDNIARLNIVPLGTFGPHFQKDSLDANWFYDTYDEDKPIIYLTFASTDHVPKWSLKKAVFDKEENKWSIFSVIDSPYDVGGLSSQDGRTRNIIMNDYALPGWGPALPVKGSATTVPGVSEVSASHDRPTYPLVGRGPLGLTAMTGGVFPLTKSGGVSGRTCIHMNPKLLDYDKSGVPHTLIAKLWQDNLNTPCSVEGENGRERLPAVGNYLYRYKGPDPGWQLDLQRGLVSDEVQGEVGNGQGLTPKLLAGTQHTLIAAGWNGTVESIYPDRAPDRNTEQWLDCSKSGVHGRGGGARRRRHFPRRRARHPRSAAEIRGCRRCLPLRHILRFQIFYAREVTGEISQDHENLRIAGDRTFQQALGGSPARGRLEPQTALCMKLTSGHETGAASRG